MAYTDDDLLFLSGIQHFRFCRRQWALIHIDMQWTENRLTIEGNYLHRNADNPEHRIRSGESPALRAVPLVSYRLGITGISDVVELIAAEDPDNSITVSRFPGRGLPYPVEYKHGRPKNDNCDILQLTAQAMCLEEKHGIRIPRGAMYYAATHKRLEVEFSSALRHEVADVCANMHRLYSQAVIPPPEYGPKCRNCSLYDCCNPEVVSGQWLSDYLKILDT